MFSLPARLVTLAVQPVAVPGVAVVNAGVSGNDNSTSVSLPLFAHSFSAAIVTATAPLLGAPSASISTCALATSGNRTSAAENTASAATDFRIMECCPFGCWTDRWMDGQPTVTSAVAVTTSSCVGY